MPRTTYAYPFEWKVFELANKLSAILTGECRTFLLIFPKDGVAQNLTFEVFGTSWYDFTKKLENASKPYLFYDPFDFPEYAFLSWYMIEKSTIKRLIGQPLQELDFVSRHSNTFTHGQTLQSMSFYPVSWKVIFYRLIDRACLKVAAFLK